MATETELYQQILTKLGVDCNNLPAHTLTTLLTAIAQNCGGGAGGGGVFLVTQTIVDGALVLDKTYAEIKAAYESGSVVQMLSGNFLLPLVQCPLDGALEVFCTTYLNGSTMIIMQVQVSADNIITGSAGTLEVTMMGGEK